MNIVFRVDASTVIGTGHVRRCLTLADYLSAQGHMCTFVCRDLVGNLMPLILEMGHKVICLRAPENFMGKKLESPSELNYEEWLGVSWEEDLSEFLVAVRGIDNPLIVVDHYGLDWRWESGVRQHSYVSMIVIDDLANRKHFCDVLIDQTPLRSSSCYRKFVNEKTLILAGSKYALIREEFTRKIAIETAHELGCGKQISILLCMGGGNKNEINEEILASLMSFEFISRIDLINVIGLPSNKQLYSPQAVGPKITFIEDSKDIAKLMAESTFAIGAGGVTALERCLIGLPSILIPIAENQTDIANALSDMGAVFLVKKDDFFNVNFKNALEKMLSEEIRGEVRRKCKKILDGGGVPLIGSLINNVSFPLKLRDITFDDAKILYDWALDYEVRSQSFSSSKFSYEDHIVWFKSKIENLQKSSYIFILDDSESKPIGQIRFDRNSQNQWVIDYSVDSKFRGFGIGGLILAMGESRLLKLLGATFLLAVVKSENFKSSKVFKSLGYSENISFEKKNITYTKKVNE